MNSSSLTRLFAPTAALLAVTLLLIARPLTGIPIPVPTLTYTPSPIPTSTRTPTPTLTPVPTSTPTSTSTPTPTTTPTFTPAPPPAAAKVPILMYHYIGDLPPDADIFRRDLTVSAENLEAQLRYLAEAGYHTVTLTDLYHHLADGWYLPPRSIILTFDDGYRDAYTVAFPLLQKYGFVGTFFVLVTPTDQGNPRYMTWEMMKEMADAGMEIQGHGRDHVDMHGRPYDYLVYQIGGVKEAVESHTGKPVLFFCYPSGNYDGNVIAVLQATGYWGAVTTQYGRLHTADRLYTLSRIRIRGADSLDAFIDKVEGR